MGVHPNMDEDLNRRIAEHQRGLGDWTHGKRDLAGQAARAQEWFASLWSELVAPACGGLGCPPVHLVFAVERKTRLGHYCRGRNQCGLRWEISVNPVHLGTRSEVEVASTCLHELVHLAEDLGASGKPVPRSRNSYHSAWFRRQVAGFGIPCTKYGAEQGIRFESPIILWAKRHGLSGKPSIEEEEEEDRKPRAKRDAWTCRCPEEKRVIVMVAAGQELDATCGRCDGTFRRRDAGESEAAAA